MRLQRFLAESGVASRRASEKLISEGRVKVNGAVASVGQTVDPAHDIILLDDLPVKPDYKIYVLLNKPAGVVTTAKDTHSRPTVLDYVRDVGARVFPVGRLDMDVEGALILTNDGEMAFRLCHPSYQVDKIYLAWVEGTMSPETAVRLEKGVWLEDGLAVPTEVVVLNTGSGQSLVRLVLREGRKREVKRICKAVGHPVRELQRVGIANVRVKGLQPGEWRHLRDTEVESLRKLVGLQTH